MIAYTHVMEWIHGYESLVSGMLFTLENLLFVVSPLMLLYISTDTMIFIWVSLFMNAVACLVFLMFYFPESPVFLLDSGKYEEFEAIVQRLYKDNNVHE